MKCNVSSLGIECLPKANKKIKQIYVEATTTMTTMSSVKYIEFDKLLLTLVYTFRRMDELSHFAHKLKYTFHVTSSQFGVVRQICATHVQILDVGCHIYHLPPFISIVNIYYILHDITHINWKRIFMIHKCQCESDIQSRVQISFFIILFNECNYFVLRRWQKQKADAPKVND